MMDPFIVHQGVSPLILAFPHVGTWLPDQVHARLNDNGQVLADTDWYVYELYDGLIPAATTVRATFHRYVIDANRDPSGTSLYPGQNTTGLVPLTDFDGQAIWRTGMEPTETDIAERLAGFHAPYHAALRAEIERIKAIHGIAVVYDCHSIRSQIPYLFEGTLPDFNIGTNGGRSCDPAIERVAEETAAAADGLTHAVNGRFKGGWTTRVVGQPASGVHAIQMEMAQSAHLLREAPPFTADPAKVTRLRRTLLPLLQRIEAAAFGLKSQGHAR